jgi:hypothetical protein
MAELTCFSWHGSQDHQEMGFLDALYHESSEINRLQIAPVIRWEK